MRALFENLISCADSLTIMFRGAFAESRAARMASWTLVDCAIEPPRMLQSDPLSTALVSPRVARVKDFPLSPREPCQKASAPSRSKKASAKAENGVTWSGHTGVRGMVTPHIARTVQ